MSTEPAAEPTASVTAPTTLRLRRAIAALLCPGGAVGLPDDRRLGRARRAIERVERRLEVVEDEPHRRIGGRGGEQHVALVAHDEDAALAGRQLDLRQRVAAEVAARGVGGLPD